MPFLQDTYAVLPRAGEAQLRIFNGFNCKVAVDVSGVDSVTIEPLSFWQAQTLLVDGESTYDVSGHGDGCDDHVEFRGVISVTEKEVICSKSLIRT
jgi:solute carrier family 15 oligopeptide transporter 1